MIGKRLAHYEIVEKLGQGGRGEVWKARDTALDRDVAIKMLPEAFAADPERLARFEREAKLLASLNHPAIAAIHGETVSDSLGAILHKDPDRSSLPPGTPPTVRLLLRRCMAKNPEKPLHDIADARIELELAIEDPSNSSMGLADAALTAAGARRRRSAWSWLPAAGSLGALAVGLAVGWMLRGAPAPAPLRKLDLGEQIAGSSGGPVEVAISPDGRQVAFTHQGHLWVQALDTLEPRSLEGTEGALETGAEPRLGKEARLFSLPAVEGRGGFIPANGGERFLVIEPLVRDEDETVRSGIKVVQNWYREFERQPRP